ncbi:hypothetical protein CISG_06205 [Coccidioides immitis RMSCC 3703]|uniref:Uncharacterized protein n=1 Tax=Coccidioides immitis RMSCC 3703 TaxID=454286 RepID=A0A0J8QY54_COCIT|nr:hypothetical protein CISG_06205 [Coccidioides immitis RMSCC 3703]
MNQGFLHAVYGLTLIRETVDPETCPKGKVELKLPAPSCTFLKVQYVKPPICGRRRCAIPRGHFLEDLLFTSGNILTKRPESKVQCLNAGCDFTLFLWKLDYISPRGIGMLIGGM